jgi:hypothetical protein
MFNLTFETIIEQTERNRERFVWTSIRSIDELDRARMAAMTAFLDDFPAGKAEGRYLDAELPALPFAGGSFDLALSSHFLFLYSDSSAKNFIARPCARSAAWLPKCGFFRFLPSTAAGRRW